MNWKKFFCCICALCVLLASGVGVYALPYNEDAPNLRQCPVYCNNNSNPYQSISSNEANIFTLKRTMLNGTANSVSMLLAVPTLSENLTDYFVVIQGDMPNTSGVSFSQFHGDVTPLQGCSMADGVMTFFDSHYEFSIRGSFSNVSTSFQLFRYTDKWVGDTTFEPTTLIFDDTYYIGSSPEEGLTVDTYSYTLPYGTTAKFTANRIDQIYVRYDISPYKAGSLLGAPSFYTAKYSYAGNPNTMSALTSAVQLPLVGYGKKSVLGAFSTFECYVPVSGNQVNIFNALDSDESHYHGTIYVNITTLGVPNAIVYQPNGRADIIMGNFSDTVNPEGTAEISGGLGTSESPYQMTPTVNGQVVDMSQVGFETASSNGSVLEGFASLLNGIFSIPSQVVDNLTSWSSGISSVIGGIYSAFPVEISQLVITFFSLVLLIGVIKLFL